MSGIIIDVNAKTDKSQKALDDINKSLSQMNSTVEKTSKQFSSLAVSVGSMLASSLSLAYLKSVSDQFTNMSNKIRLVTADINEQNKSYNALIKISNKTASSFSATTAVFTTFGKSLKNVSADKILSVTETVQKAVAVSGASAQSAEAAIIQLGQGLSAGALRGEELNSVMEQTPRLAQAIADSLNVSLGGLRALAAEGKVTTDVVFKALADQAGKIDQEFGSMNRTMGQSFQLMTNALAVFTSEADKGLGVSASISSVLSVTASRFNDWAENVGVSAFLFASDMRMLLQDVTTIAKPIILTLVNFAKLVSEALPKGFLTSTFGADLRNAMRDVDTFFGGFFTNLRFAFAEFQNIFYLRSPVEKALSQLRRLSPTNWLTAGFDKETLSDIFSRRTLLLYAGAFSDLASAIKDEMSGIMANIRKGIRNISYGFQDVLRYVGILKDTFVTFRFGNFEALAQFLVDAAKGILNVKIGIWQVGRIIQDAFGSYTAEFGRVIADFLPSIPQLAAEVIVTLVSLVKKGVEGISQIISDLFNGTSSKVVAAVSRPLEALGRISSGKWMSNTKDKVEEFISFIVDGFVSLYSKVISGDSWGKLIESVVEGSLELANAARQGMSKLVEAFSDAFDNIRSNVKKRISGIKDTIKEFISDVAEVGLINAIMTRHFASAMGRSINVTLGIETNPAVKALAKFEDAFGGTLAAVYAALSEAEWGIRRFATRVIDFFFEIYDEVIGHSYWTDTILYINNSSRDLYSTAGAGILKFKNLVVDAFSNIQDKASNIFSRITDGISVEKIKELGSTISGNLRLAIEAGIAGIAATLLALMFPAAAITMFFKTYFIRAVFLAVGVLSEKLTQTLFDESLFFRAGETLGTIIGRAIVNGIKILPEVINFILSSVSGLLKGIGNSLSEGLKDVPIVGKLLGFLAESATNIATSGPFGVIGTFLLGVKGLELVRYLGFFKESIDGIFGLGARLTKSSKDGGLVPQFLAGSLGLTKTYALLAGILSLTGAFDSIKAGGPINALLGGLLDAGILATFIGGDKFVNSLKGVLSDKVIAPLVDTLSALVGKSQIAKSVVDLFTGNLQGKAFDKLSNTILDKLTKGFEKGKTNLANLMFGPSGEGLEVVNSRMDSFKAVIIGKLKELGTNMLKVDLFKKLWDSKAMSNMRDLASKAISAMSSRRGNPIQMSFDFSAAEPQQAFFDFTQNVERQATRVGGQTGLMGKLFGNPRNLMIAFGVAGMLFAGMASAAEQVSASIGYSVSGEIAKAFQGLTDRNPIATWVALSTPLLLTIGWVFREQVVAGMAYAIKGLLSQAFMTAMGTFIAGMGRMTAAALRFVGPMALVGTAISGINLVMTDSATSFDKISFAVSALVAVLSFAKMSWLTAIWGMIKGLGSLILAFSPITIAAGSMWAAVLGPIAGILAAFAAVGTALVWIFGEGDSLGEKFANTWYSIAKAIGLAANNLSYAQNNIREILGTKGAKVFDESGIANLDFERLTKDQKANLEKLANKVKEANERAAEDVAFNGSLSPESAKEIHKTETALKNYSQKLGAAASKGFYTALKDYEKSLVGVAAGSGPSAWLNRTKGAALGLANDFVVSNAREELRLDPNNVDKQQRLAEHLRQRDLAYKPTYAGLGDQDGRILALTDALEDMDILSTLPGADSAIKNLEATRKNLTELNKAYATSKSDVFTPLRITKLFDSARQRVGETFINQLEDLLRLQKDSKEIKAFQDNSTKFLAALADSGIKTEEGATAVFSDEDQKQLQQYIDKIKFINEKGLPNARTWEEAHAKAVEKKVAQIQAATFAMQQNEKYGMNSTEAIGKAFERMNIGISSSSVKGLGKFKYELLDSVHAIDKMKDELKLPGLQIDSKTTPEEKAAIEQKIDSIYQRIAEATANLKNKVKSLLNKGDTLSGIQVLSALGLESIPDEISAAFGSKGSASFTKNALRIDSINKSLTPDITGALRDDRGYELTNAQVESLKAERLSLNKRQEDLKARAADLTAINSLEKELNRIKSAGVSISDSMVNSILKQKMFGNELVEIARKQEELDELRKRAAKVDYRGKDAAKLLADIAKLETDIKQRAEKLNIEISKMTIGSVSSLLSGAGFENVDINSLFYISEETRNSWVELAASIQKAKAIMEDATKSPEERAKALTDYISGTSKVSSINAASSINRDPSAAIRSVAPGLSDYQSRNLDPQMAQVLKGLAYALKTLESQKATGAIKPEEFDKEKTKIDETARQTLVDGGKWRESIQLDSFVANKDLTQTVSQYLTGITSKQWSDIRNKYASEIKSLEERMAGADPDTQLAIEKMIGTLKDRMAEELKNANNSVDTKASEAGKQFATSIKDSFQNELYNSLVNGDKFNMKAIWSSFATGIIGNVTKGFTEAIMGEGGMINNLLKGIGGDAFNLGSLFGGQKNPALDGNTSALRDLTLALKQFQTATGLGGASAGGGVVVGSPGFVGPAEQTGDDFLGDMDRASADGIANTANATSTTAANTAESNSWLSNISTNQMLGFAGLTAAVAGIASSGMSNTDKAYSLFTTAVMAYGMYGRASGGWINGPGNSTSDSIPVRLSKGEYVVNAKSASKYGDLIEAINSDNLGGFAMGGPIGGSLKSDKVANILARNSNSNTSVFNINVTGDISRQTKSEILKMLPAITSGVNANNRESGAIR